MKSGNFSKLYLQVLVAVWVVHFVINSDGISEVPFVLLIVVKLLKQLVAHFAAVVLPSKHCGDFSLDLLWLILFLSLEPTLGWKLENVSIRKKNCQKQLTSLLQILDFLKLDPVGHIVVPLPALRLLGTVLFSPVLPEVPIQVLAVPQSLLRREPQTTRAALYATIHVGI